MPVKREVKSKVALPKKEEVLDEVKEQEVVVAEGFEEKEGIVTQPKKVRCFFCAEKSEPKYWDSTALRRFVSDRGRILPRARTGVCSKHQKRVTKHIKYARHLAMVPFLVRA